jgi:hypothetical protein
MAARNLGSFLSCQTSQQQHALDTNTSYTNMCSKSGTTSLLNHDHSSGFNITGTCIGSHQAQAMIRVVHTFPVKHQNPHRIWWRLFTSFRAVSLHSAFAVTAPSGTSKPGGIGTSMPILLSSADTCSWQTREGGLLASDD